jgi:phosphoserine phosphatase
MADRPLRLSASSPARHELPEGLSATLVLVRHGESTWVAEGRFQGSQDPPLSELGRRQAALVGQRLAERDGGVPLPIPLGPPLAIWHSPLARAQATASIIASCQPQPPPLHALAGLTEIGQGEWEGLPAAEVRARWPAELDAWRRDPSANNAPGGERVVDAAARVTTALDDVILSLVAQATPRPTGDEAVVPPTLHADPVPGYPSPNPTNAGPPDGWAVLVAHDGIFRLTLMSLLGVPVERFWSFPFSLCAITVVALNHGVATLRAHNLAEHLSPLADEERAAAEARGDRRGAL